MFTKKASELTNIATEFLTQFNDQLKIFEANIEKSKSKMFEEFGNPDDTFGDSQDGDGYDSDEDDEDMEVVPAPVRLYFFNSIIIYFNIIACLIDACISNTNIL